jgi:SAM-dependent methyltransferase
MSSRNVEMLEGEQSVKKASERRGTRTIPDRAAQWAKVARNWELYGPPLRPSREDLRFSEEAVGAWRGQGSPPRVLLLGVTPELYRLAWREGTDFLAVDRSIEVIEAVWPGPREAVRCEDWLEMKLPAASRDIVLCDGGLNLLAYPDEQQRLASILGEVLAEEGLCILRLFVRPAEKETRDAVLTDLLAGRIADMNVLKLRLWAALQETPSQGVELDTVWRAVQGAAGSLDELALKLGWPLEETLFINAYRDSTTRYWVGTVDEVAKIFCQDAGGFELAGVHVPSYECGPLCPTVVLRRT